MIAVKSCKLRKVTFGSKQNGILDKKKNNFKIKNIPVLSGKSEQQPNTKRGRNY